MSELSLEIDASIHAMIRRALAEDVGSGDVTTLALVPAKARAKAAILARTPCVVAGSGVAAAVFAAVNRSVRCTFLVGEGASCDAEEEIMTVEGSARGILTAERTALNFMQRMTGIATLTRRFVEKAWRHGVKILDTRKTTPGLRILEKHAVRCGGGVNHRMGLYDRALLKDNHRKLWGRGDPQELYKAVKELRGRFPGIPVEVEVESEEELQNVLQAKPEWVLLDNMPPARLRRCVEICAHRCKLEASGGITMDNIEVVAATGVDAISLGCLTHSAPAADLSLELV